MKPGSSDRCKSKRGHLRCGRRTNHTGDHQAATGNGTTFWADPRDLARSLFDSLDDEAKRRGLLAN